MLRLYQQVVGLDSFATGHQRNVDEALAAVGAERANRLRMITGDIRDARICAQGRTGIEIVLHWWGTRVVRLWRAEQPDLIALAATITSGAILAHSIVDYPLRDAAIQAVFAVSLAFMAESRSHDGGRRSRSDKQERAPRHMTLDDHGSFSG